MTSFSYSSPKTEPAFCCGLSRSGYYDWLTRAPSARSIEDAAFKERIAELHKQARGRYGHRPIYHHLQDEAFDCGRDRTLRLMKERSDERTGYTNGLKGRTFHSSLGSLSLRVPQSRGCEEPYKASMLESRRVRLSSC